MPCWAWDMKVSNLSVCLCAGANGLFSQCIQQAGYGFTSPGHSFYHWDAKSFDPGPMGSQMLTQAFHNASLGTADEVSRVRVSLILVNPNTSCLCLVSGINMHDKYEMFIFHICMLLYGSD